MTGPGAAPRDYVGEAIGEYMENLPSGPVPEWGSDWDGRLDEWLRRIASDDSTPDWSFPTSELRDEYLATIHARSEEEVLDLLQRFTFEPSAFALSDAVARGALLNRFAAEGPDLRMNEHERRILCWMTGGEKPHPGVRWALDLLPDYPKQVLSVVEAYVLADWQYLPDGRIDGLYDALSIVRSYYIGLPETSEQKRLSLYDLTPRQFEVLVARLYTAMGYETELTPPTRDGGRDVNAHRRILGQHETIRIECKLYDKAVPVGVARALRGVVASDAANRGVLVTAGRFTRGARDAAAADAALDLINGGELVVLLNEHLGANWPSRLDWLLRPVEPSRNKT